MLCAQEVFETDAYCRFVSVTRSVFKTANALLHDRLNYHAARETVLAQCGVPGMDAESNILGVRCHYDLVPRDPELVDLSLMLQVASTLAQRQAIPPYPTT